MYKMRFFYECSLVWKVRKQSLWKLFNLLKIIHDLYINYRER